MCIRDRIIALDCGIKSFDLINYAKEIGIEFIVCDHHLPDEILPPAIAILNPKQIDCNYPYKELCGCGAVSYTHLRAHETVLDLVCRLLLEKKKTNNIHFISQI